MQPLTRSLFILCSVLNTVACQAETVSDVTRAGAITGLPRLAAGVSTHELAAPRLFEIEGVGEGSLSLGVTPIEFSFVHAELFDSSGYPLASQARALPIDGTQGWFWEVEAAHAGTLYLLLDGEELVDGRGFDTGSSQVGVDLEYEEAVSIAALTRIDAGDQLVEVADRRLVELAPGDEGVESLSMGVTAIEFLNPSLLAFSSDGYLTESEAGINPAPDYTDRGYFWTLTAARPVVALIGGEGFLDGRNADTSSSQALISLTYEGGAEEEECTGDSIWRLESYVSGPNAASEICDASVALAPVSSGTLSTADSAELCELPAFAQRAARSYVSRFFGGAVPEFAPMTVTWYEYPDARIEVEVESEGRSPGRFLLQDGELVAWVANESCREPAN